MTQPVILQKDGQLRIRGATFFTAEAVTRRGQTTLCPLTRGSRLTYSLSLSACSSGGFPYRDPYTGLPPPPARCDRLSLRPVSIIAFFCGDASERLEHLLINFCCPFSGRFHSPLPGTRGVYHRSPEKDNTNRVLLIIRKSYRKLQQDTAKHIVFVRFCQVNRYARNLDFSFRAIYNHRHIQTAGAQHNGCSVPAVIFRR